MTRLTIDEHFVASLRNNITDISRITSEVVSRVGPLRYSSWKYPDMLAIDVDIEDLLMKFVYSVNNLDQSVHAQFALLEIIIDRMVLFIQAANRFMELQIITKLNVLFRSNSSLLDSLTPPDTASQSINLTLRHLWQNLQRIQIGLQKAHLPADLKTIVPKDSYEVLAEKLASETLLKPIPQDSYEVFAKKTRQMSRDYSSTSVMSSYEERFKNSGDDVGVIFKSTSKALLESLQDAGYIMIETMQSHSLPSTLSKCRLQLLGDIVTISSNHVTEWCTDLSKDVSRINKYVKLLEDVVESKAPTKEMKAEKQLSSYKSVEAVDLTRKLHENQDRIQNLLKEIGDLKGSVDKSYVKEQQYLKRISELQKQVSNVETNVRILEMNLKQERLTIKQLQEELLDKVTTLTAVNNELGNLLEENQRLRSKKLVDVSSTSGRFHQR